MGAIATVYVVHIAWAYAKSTYFDAFSVWVVFPLIGAIVVVPCCIMATLLAWGCFALARRWVHASRTWAGVFGVVMTIAVFSMFYWGLMRMLPEPQEPLEVLPFGLALIVIIAVCLVRGVG